MIKGTLQSVIFANKSFAIISIMMEDNNTMVVKGEYPNPNRDIGLIIEIMGEYVNDKKYGRQFKAASVRTLAADDDGLYYFLTRIVGHVPKKQRGRCPIGFLMKSLKR